MIQAIDAHKTYRSGAGSVDAVQGVDLEIRKGEVVALVGPSGCGKSTLLHLLGALDTPSAGEIVIAGQPTQHLSDNELTLLRRRRIGFVFQFFNLLPTLTALENVTLPLELDGASADAASRAARLLDTVGLGHRLRQPAYKLSGGEMQRVATARALVHKPEILLADEPTGNLDSESAERVLATLFQLGRAEGAAVLLVTHSREIAERADRTLRMKDGRLIDAP